MKDGIYPGMSRAEYDSIDAINQSTLKHFKKSAAHARLAITNPKEPTSAMDFGNAFHCAVLEPNRFADTYVIAPNLGNRSNADKAAWGEFRANNIGKEIVTLDEMARIKAMKDACYTHPIVSKLLNGGGKNEICVVWTDKETGLRCKSLLDRTTRFMDWTVVVDLKTCEDASPNEFARAAAKYGYHEQSAFYLAGLDALAPASRRFFFVAVEKSEPHGIVIYEPDEVSLGHGRAAFRRHLTMYAQCKSTDIWPSYPIGITPLPMQSWAIEVEAPND